MRLKPDLSSFADEMAMRFFRRLLPTALAVLSFALPGSALGQAPLSPDKAFALTVTREADGDPVSYTHLTLPTKRIV